MFNFIKRLFKRNRCHYIHSNIHLPAPLNEKEEERLLIELEEKKCVESRNILIEHNLRLVVYIAKKFESKKVLIEDLISIGSMGLIKGVQTFKRDKNIKLATYASRCIENEILMFLRKISKIKNELSLDETLNVDADGNELVLADIISSDAPEVIEEVMNDEKEVFLYNCVEELTQREKEIIVLRFGLYETKSMTQKEVADYLNISQSYISRLEKKIIDKLKQDIELRIK
ncbi:MAG: sigma-70 family RNA polymerase sigma factor [bacterium]